MREMEEASRAAPVSCEAELRQSLAQAQESLRSVSEQLETARRVEGEARAEAERQMGQAQEAHLKYQNEIVLHAQDVEALNKLKEATSAHKAQAAELEEARANAEVALEETRANLDSVEQTLRAEYGKLKEQFAVVEQENAKLHAQLATVTSQMTSLQRHFEGNPDASRSFSEEESRSAEQLMEIIKFLRREKEILTGKVEVLHAESARVRSQLEQGRSNSFNRLEKCSQLLTSDNHAFELRE